MPIRAPKPCTPSTIEAWAGEMPLSRSSNGVQMTVSANVPKAMKNGIHSRTVRIAKPSANRCFNGTPSIRTSSETKRASAGTSGRKRRTTVPARAASRPSPVRNASDSGSQTINAAATAIGRIPPTQKIACQPKLVRMNEFANPPIEPPSGNAAQIRLPPWRACGLAQTPTQAQ